eukprot:860882-Pelagomonas_calceolata.AAC.1
MARLVEGMGSVNSTTHTQEDCVENDFGTLESFAHFTVLLRARSDQDSIGAAGVASSLIRNTGVKEIWRYQKIRDLLSDVQVILGQEYKTRTGNKEHKSHAWRQHADLCRLICKSRDSPYRSPGRWWNVL